MMDIEQMTIIDNELRAKYPQAPLDLIKQELLKDETAIIVTLKQYRGLLDYRLRNYRPKLKQSRRMKSIRTELLPDWFEETPQKDQWGGMRDTLKEMLDNQLKGKPSEKDIKALKEDVERMMKELRN
jgi:hypothetical protein